MVELCAEERAQVLAGKLCPYDLTKTVLVGSEEIYGSDNYPGNYWLCPTCRAYVGCYAESDRALGRVANAELRKWKNRAHEVFDALWRKSAFDKRTSFSAARSRGYQWLSQQMKLPPEQTHIGMFDVKQCQTVVRLCLPFLPAKNQRKGC